MTVAAGGHVDAEHLAGAANRQRPHDQIFRQSARHNFGGVNWRVTKFVEERQAADVILVTVAEHERVKRPHIFDVGQEARRWAFTEVEHESLASRLDDKAGGAFGADAGNKL